MPSPSSINKNKKVKNKKTKKANIKRRDREKKILYAIDTDLKKNKNKYIEEFNSIVRKKPNIIVDFISKCLGSTNISVDTQNISNLVAIFPKLAMSGHSKSKFILRKNKTIIENESSQNKLLSDIFNLNIDGDLDGSIDPANLRQLQESETDINNIIAELSSTDKKLCDSMEVSETLDTPEFHLIQNSSALSEIKDRAYIDPYSILVAPLNINDSDNWIDIGEYFVPLFESWGWLQPNTINEPLGISINKGKIELIKNEFISRGEASLDILKHHINQIPSYTIKIGLIGIKVSSLIIISIIDLLINCSKKLISLVNAIKSLQNIFNLVADSPYPPIILSIIRQLFIDPVFNIEGNSGNFSSDKLKTIQDTYNYRIFCNIFILCYHFSKKYSPPGLLNNPREFIEIGLNKILESTPAANTNPQLDNEEDNEKLFYITSMISYLVMKRDTSVNGPLFSGFNSNGDNVTEQVINNTMECDLPRQNSNILIPMLVNPVRAGLKINKKKKKKKKSKKKPKKKPKKKSKKKKSTKRKKKKSVTKRRF